MHTEFRWGNLKEKGHFQDLSIDGNTTVALKTQWEGNVRVHQTQDRNMLWALLGNVVKIIVPHYLLSYSVNDLLLTDSAAWSY